MKKIIIITVSVVAVIAISLQIMNDLFLGFNPTVITFVAVCVGGAVAGGIASKVKNKDDDR